jgi:vancomycin resistance protein YoaR
MGREAIRTRRLAWGRAASYLVGALVFLAMGLGIFMVAFPRRIAAATKVDGLDVSLLSAQDAKARLSAWWAERSSVPVSFVGPGEKAPSVSHAPSELGLAIDLDATVAQLPRDEFSHWFSRSARGRTPEVRSYPIVFKSNEIDFDKLELVVAKTSPPLAPAMATLDEGGKVVLTPEVSRMKLVRAQTARALREAVVGQVPCRLPAMFVDKHVPDSELSRIKEVVSTFSTKFSAGDRSRSSNLKVAAAKLDGVVLMPGEKFSFNEYVGERTAANGFKEAGVYRHGRHEIDWGGGVCQVSTTLFNAVVRANMKVNTRNNHTFLVPYVPVGCDAAVAYGSYDFVFTNTLDTPVALDSKYETGKLTFTVLGIKDSGLEVKLVPVVTQVTTHEPKYIEDPLLKPGEEKEVEKGGKGFRATTTKIVLRNGVEVSRETFKSYYKGGPKIIARGPAKAVPIEMPPIIDPGL